MNSTIPVSRVLPDRPRYPVVTVSLGVAISLLPGAGAVLFYSTDSANHNVINTVSDHTLAKYVGLFGGYTGTPFAPNYFLTSKHIGVASSLSLGGVSYSVAAGAEGTAFWSDAQSDLRIVKISGTFPANLISPLFVTGTEVGKTLTVFGRGGAPRGRGQPGRCVRGGSSGLVHRGLGRETPLG